MRLPKYIQKKIKAQNDALSRAENLRLEVEQWTESKGVDVYDDKWLESAICPDGSLYEKGIKKIFEEI